MTQAEPKYLESWVYCDSCWWCDDLQYNRSAAVMYCHYHEEAYEDFEICDDYDNAEKREKDPTNAPTKMKSEER